MVDSIEIRLDQLTQAVKGLYAKSSMSQGEIYNALTSLSQRYENLTNISNEKIAATLVTEFRKTIDVKYGQTNQQIREFENTLKNFVKTQQAQNPKMAAEITKLLSDTSNTFAKLNQQDMAMQKILNTIELQRSENPSREIAKLGENFTNFSRNFETITTTLDKNFADFLSHLQANTTKEEYNQIKNELDTMTGGINSIISAISIIDNKYRDLSNLIEAVQNRENIFNSALNEVRNLTVSIQELKENINAINPKDALEQINTQINANIENVKKEVEKIAQISNTESITTELFNMTSAVNNIQNGFQQIASNNEFVKAGIENIASNHEKLEENVKTISSLNEDVKSGIQNLTEAVSGLQGEISKTSSTSVNSYEDLKMKLQEFQNSIDNIQNEVIKSSNSSAITNEETKALIQSLQNSLANIKLDASGNKTIDPTFIANIQELSDMLNGVAGGVQGISSNLGSIVNDVQNNLQDFASSFTNVISNFQGDVQSLNTNLTNSNDIVKSNIQTLSNSVNDIQNCIHNLSSNLSNSNDNFKFNLENLVSVVNGLQGDLRNITNNVNGTNEKFGSFKADLETITNNVNTIISAISIMDNKFKEDNNFTSLNDNNITSISSEIKTLTSSLNELKENIVSQNIKLELQSVKEELKNSIHSNNVKADLQAHYEEINNKINSISVNQDVQALSLEIENSVEAIKNEIMKIINTSDDEAIKTEISDLTNSITTVQGNIQNLTTNINNSKEEIQNLTETIQNLGGEVKNIKSLVNDEIIYKGTQRQNEFVSHMEKSKEDIKAILDSMTSLKSELNDINQGNIQLLQEPIEKALSSLKNEGVGKDIQELSQTLRDTTLEIQSSIQNLQANLDNISSVSGVNVLTQISQSIPTIVDKLEMFREHILNENNSNLDGLKTVSTETIKEIRENLRNAIEKIQDDSKTINLETIDSLKVDLQRLSDHLVDSVDSVIENVQKQFAGFKVDIQELSLKQQDNQEKLLDQIQSLEVNLESFNQETASKFSEALNSNNAYTQDILNETKSDILEGIVSVDKNTRSSLAQFDDKINKLLDSYIGPNLDSIVEKKSFREAIIDIENKVDRTNLQQIHNAKELLEEIQTATSNLTMKIANLEESKNTTAIMNAISRITEKIQGIEEFNQELTEALDDSKEEMDKKLKDNVQKISTLIDNSNNSKSTDGQSNIDNLSAKVQEYLSNFEYLKSNISQEIKENLESEFNKVITSIKKIKSQDIESDYSYTLEDVESDLTKMRMTIEKTATNSEELKPVLEKISELRSVGLENVKINRDMENSLGHLSGWFKDAVVKIDDLGDRLDAIQNIGFEDIRTRLIQSEKSKANSNEFCAKIENALKYLIKCYQNQEGKIGDIGKKVDLMSQAQTESFNPNQFIDIFYENMTQTKILANRVEIIEDKINSIQTAVEKLISYVEQ